MTQQVKNQGFSNSTTNDDVFADFEPPATTDGSYMGTMKHVRATEDHLEEKFRERLELAKTDLKKANCKVGLKVTGGSIQLQATLPPKPGSDKTKPHQQIISLKIPANLAGLKTAVEEAHALGMLIARKQFEWNDKYLEVEKEQEVKIPTIGELLEKFEVEYYKTRPMSAKSKVTFAGYYDRIKRFMPTEQTLTIELIRKSLLAINSVSSQQTFLIAVKVLAKTFKLEIDFSEIAKINYTPQSRQIPSDEKIVSSYYEYEKRTKNTKDVRLDNRDNWKLWKWCYGMLAAYGLRPRELFVYPNINWWLSAENIDNTWKVHKDCKTGEREVFPLHQEWIKLFDLKNSESIKILLEKTNDLSIQDLHRIVTQNSFWFTRYLKLGFKPYDLRHAWAIRAHLMGIPIKAAADNLGHSVEMHTKTYQRWFGRDNRKKAINEAIAKKSEVNLIMEENEQLKLEVQRLKLEVQRLKLHCQYNLVNNDIS